MPRPGGTPENLIPAKPGEVRNPKGINGWTKARERVAKALEDNADSMVQALVELANEKDTNALKLALGPLLPEVKTKVEHEGTVSFVDLAKKATETDERD